MLTRQNLILIGLLLAQIVIAVVVLWPRNTQAVSNPGVPRPQGRRCD